MKKRSILIAVNQSIIALDIKKILITNNFIIAGIVNTGEDLVKHYKANKPDLVIVTYRLKGKKSGIEAIKEINNIDNTPIIIISASLIEQVNDFAKLISSSAVLAKPFRADDLLNLVNKFFIFN